MRVDNVPKVALDCAVAGTELAISNHKIQCVNHHINEPLYKSFTYLLTYLLHDYHRPSQPSHSLE